MRELPDLVDHGAWPQIVPRIRLEPYARDGGHAHPRIRIEVVTPTTASEVAALLAVRCACCACERPIAPIRERDGGRRSHQHLYVAVACELEVRYGCSKGRAAKEAYLRIIAAVRAWQTGQQPGLFDAH